MNIIEELEELYDRTSIFENRTQPKDKGIIIGAIHRIYELENAVVSEKTRSDKTFRLLRITEDHLQQCKDELAKQKQ